MIPYRPLARRAIVHHRVSPGSRCRDGNLARIARARAGREVFAHCGARSPSSSRHAAAGPHRLGGPERSARSSHAETRVTTMPSGRAGLDAAVGVGAKGGRGTPAWCRVDGCQVVSDGVAVGVLRRWARSRDRARRNASGAVSGGGDEPDLQLLNLKAQFHPLAVRLAPLGLA
jgi:hypothetical protein